MQANYKMRLGLLGPPNAVYHIWCLSPGVDCDGLAIVWLGSPAKRQHGLIPSGFDGRRKYEKNAADLLHLIV